MGCGEPGLAQRPERRGSAAAVRVATLGLGLPCPLCRLLARARPALLGRDQRRAHVPAASWCLAAQGLVPHHRHRHRCRPDRAADRVLPAGARGLSHRSGALGRRLRIRRHPSEELRGLCGGAGRLHGRDRRERCPGCHRRPGCAGLHARDQPRHRDLRWHRVRRHRPRRHRFRRCPAPAGGPARGAGGGHREAIHRHAGGAKIGAAGDSSGSTRAHPAGHCARSRH